MCLVGAKKVEDNSYTHKQIGQLSPKTLNDLSGSTFDTVFVNRGDFDKYHRGDGLDEPDSIGKTLLTGALLTFSLPAQLAVVLAGHLQTHQDMR